MATVEGEGVLKGLATLRSELISAVNHPAVSLHQDGRSEVLIRVPPVRGARCRAAGAKNALIETIQLLAVLNRLQVLALRLRGLLLQEGLNRLVLGVELGQIGNQILDNVGYTVEETRSLRLMSLINDASTILSLSPFFCSPLVIPRNGRQSKEAKCA